MPLSDDYKDFLGRPRDLGEGGYDPSHPYRVDAIGHWRWWFFFWERLRVEKTYLHGDCERQWIYRWKVS